MKDQDAFERKLLAIRKQTQNPLGQVAEKQGLPELADFYIAVLLEPHPRLQGHAARPPGRRLLHATSSTR